MKLLPFLGLLLLFVQGCPSPVPAAPLDAEQIRIVRQIEQRADAAEKALATEHAGHLAAEAADAVSKNQVAALGKIAADARADAAKWKAESEAETRAKHHAWELLGAVMLAGAIIVCLIGAQVEAMLRGLGIVAVHEVLEIPGLLKWVLKLAPLLAIF